MWRSNSLSLVAAVLLATTLNAAADSARVLPVLSQESGRIEALLLLDAPASDAREGALDRVLELSPSAKGGGITLQLGNGQQISTSLSLDAQPGLALLCRGNIGLAAALGALAEQCLLADIGGIADPLLSAGTNRRVALEGGWGSSDSAIDVRFGLSWLDVAYSPDAGAGSALLASSRSSLRGFGVGSLAALSPSLPLAITSTELSASGRYRFGDQSWLQLAGALSRSLATGPTLGAPLRMDTTALSFDAGYGAFSGRLTGRLIEVPPVNLVSAAGLPSATSSFDVDLGVSWRSPWRARLTVGARNLLGNPDVSQWPLSVLPRDIDKSSDTRTPFVRYHQDL